MAIENPEAPRRDDENPGAWKEDPHQSDRERATRRVEPRGDEGNEPWRDENADEHRHRHHDRQQPQNRAGQLAGVFFPAVLEEP